MWAHPLFTGTPSPANVLIFISFIMPISVFSIRTHTPGLFKGVCRVSYKPLLIVYFIYLFNIYHLHSNFHLWSSRYFTQTSAAGPLHGPEGWKPRSPLTGEGCAPGHTGNLWPGPKMTPGPRFCPLSLRCMRHGVLFVTLLMTIK